MADETITTRIANLIPQLTDQTEASIPGIIQVMARMMQGVNLIDGLPVGIRAGMMAQCMAKANTARRVRDLDGYRQALREVAALSLTALLEIGEPVMLPEGIDAWTYWRSLPVRSRNLQGGMRAGPYGPSHLPQSQRDELGEILAEANSGVDPRDVDGYYRDPETQPSVRDVLDPNGCRFQAGQMVCKLATNHEGRHSLIDPFTHSIPADEIVTEILQVTGWTPDPGPLAVSTEDGDEAPD